jgi:uncharacterized protein (DUF983 family)
MFAMTVEIRTSAPATAIGIAVASADARDTGRAIWNGLRQRCPSCGTGRMFAGYLKVADRCTTCGTELHHQRADDAPPYFTMFVVGHLVIGGVLAMEQAYQPASWVQMAVWLPTTLILSLALLPRIKGALIAYQWALRMHGFGGTALDPAAPLPMPDTGTDKR